MNIKQNKTVIMEIILERKYILSGDFNVKNLQADNMKEWNDIHKN